MIAPINRQSPKQKLFAQFVVVSAMRTGSSYWSRSPKASAASISWRSGPAYRLPMRHSICSTCGALGW
jgi:hypothetical protein